jgi:hypothetical protein
MLCVDFGGLLSQNRIWTPPVLQAFHYIWIGVRLHTYIRPLI